MILALNEHFTKQDHKAELKLYFRLQDGTIEIWQMVENVITEWRCIVRTNQFSAEMFIKAHFIPTRRKVHFKQNGFR